MEKELRRYSVRYSFEWGVFIGTPYEEWKNGKSATIIDCNNVDEAILIFPRQVIKDNVRNLRIHDVNRLDDGLGIDDEEYEHMISLNEIFKENNGAL